MILENNEDIVAHLDRMRANNESAPRQARLPDGEFFRQAIRLAWEQGYRTGVSIGVALGKGQLEPVEDAPEWLLELL